MNTRKGSVLVKAVVGVAALGIAGAAAHHLSGGDCPLGLFPKHHGDATTVSLGSDGSGTCPMGNCDRNRIATTEAAYFEDAIPVDAVATSCDQPGETDCKEVKDGAQPINAEQDKLAARQGK